MLEFSGCILIRLPQNEIYLFWNPDVVYFVHRTHKIQKINTWMDVKTPVPVTVIRSFQYISMTSFHILFEQKAWLFKVDILTRIIADQRVTAGGRGHRTLRPPLRRSRVTVWHETSGGSRDETADDLAHKGWKGLRSFYTYSSSRTIFSTSSSSRGFLSPGRPQNSPTMDCLIEAGPPYRLCVKPADHN